MITRKMALVALVLTGACSSPPIDFDTAVAIELQRHLDYVSEESGLPVFAVQQHGDAQWLDARIALASYVHGDEICTVTIYMQEDSDSGEWGGHRTHGPGSRCEYPDELHGLTHMRNGYFNNRDGFVGVGGRVLDPRIWEVEVRVGFADPVSRKIVRRETFVVPVNDGGYLFTKGQQGPGSEFTGLRGLDYKGDAIGSASFR